MNRLEQISQKIQEFPVPKPIYSVETDWSGDIRFRTKHDKPKTPYDSPDCFEELIPSNISKQLQRDDNNVHFYVNDVHSTLSNMLNVIKSDLVDGLRRSLPNVDPKRTKIYKWFKYYSPKTTKEKELMLAIYNYYKTNPSCTDSKTKQAEAFVGLIHHIQILSNQR